VRLRLDVSVENILFALAAPAALGFPFFISFSPPVWSRKMADI
jgi:hypothetical protein